MHRIFSIYRRTGLRFLGIPLLFGMVTACSGYRLVQIDVLKPASSNAIKGDLNIVFLDRKYVHQSDAGSVSDLKKSLNLTREDLVNCFYDGLRDGFRNGGKPVTLEKAIGLTTTVVEDSVVPSPLSPMEVKAIGRQGSATHVLALDYCIFRLDPGSRVFLNNNLLLHLYRVSDGQIVDTIHSEFLQNANGFEEDDEVATICEFFYQKGRACAAEIVPTWIPTERRIYTGDNLLKLGYYYMKDENFEEAYRLWSVLLNMKPVKAAKAANNIAWLYEQNGNFKGAIVLLETALQQLKGQHKENGISEYLETYIQVLKQRETDDAKILNQL